MPFILEQSDTEIYSSFGGLSVVGSIINRHSDLKENLKHLPLRHGIPHIDLVRTYLGILCQGKNDFEAVEGIRDDAFFQQAMGITKMPSSARLRQRFDENAKALTEVIDGCLTPMLKQLKAKVTALPSGHVALHADVFCLDNSRTQKEGVSRTYHGYDGYAPIGAYIGEEGWCVGMELRPGSQHSQKDFNFFLDRVLPRAKQLADNKPLLVTLDSGHDAASNREQLKDADVDYLIKWNPRTEDAEVWRERAEKEDLFTQVREGKRIAIIDEIITWSFSGTEYQARRMVCLTERTIDRQGQPLLFPELELNGWWTSLNEVDFPPNELITLYKSRGTSEQYHSEFKTDLDLVRLPSGKLETNELVMAMAGLAYNILRYIGQNTLIGPDAPVRKAAKRRRIRTVLQEMIYKAVRLIRHGRRYLLRFGRGDPGYEALARCYVHLNSY